MASGNEKESAVETYFCQRAERDDMFVAKFVDPTSRGAPDRILFTPWGYVYFVELKRPRGGRYSALQIIYHTEMAKRRTPVYGLHTKEAVDSFFRMIAQ